MSEKVLASLRFVSMVSAALALTSAHADAQPSPVAPMGAQNVALGPGTGVTSPVSPTGGFATAVPLDLPAARGGVPVPLSIGYTASPRVGAAGAGWDIPLSYVRVSEQAWRRKPIAGSDPAEIPKRVLLTLDGATAVMTHRSDADVWVPAVASSYEELSAVVDTTTGATAAWELRTTGGLIYTFTHVDGTPQDLWLLTEVRDLGGHDRVSLGYSVWAADEPAIDLTTIRYGYGPNNSPLYEVSLSYSVWPGTPIIARYRDLDRTVRTDIVSSVTVASFNNLTTSASARHRLRKYELTYAPDTDTGMPRLGSVVVRGEEGLSTDPALPLVSYTYGAISDGAHVTLGPQVAAYPGYSSVAGMYSNGFATTAVINVGFGFEGRYARQVVRDFTGDGVPDLVFKTGDTWHVHAGLVSGGAVAFDGTDYTWDEFPEISMQLTTTPQADDAASRAIAITTETFVEFIDWNGDGRVDVVQTPDTNAGANPRQWRVWINQGPKGNRISWRAMDVPVGNLIDQLTYSRPLYFPNRDNGGVLPLERTRSWPRAHLTTCQSGYYDEYHKWIGTPCAPTNDTTHVDTITEWTLRDANGDGFVDFYVEPAVSEQESSSTGAQATTGTRTRTPGGRSALSTSVS